MNALDKLQANGISVDLESLVTFLPAASISLFDIMDLEQELSTLFKRPVDVVEPDSLTNPVRRREILATKALLYAA